MEERLQLSKFGRRLWTRHRAAEVRQQVVATLDNLKPGDAIVINAKGVEVFDYSFANELFGKTILEIPHAYPGRFFAVEHLAPYARENLEKTLESLGLAMIELIDGQPHLLGKTHPTDIETFDVIARAGRPVAAADLRDQLGLAINAVNERLAKLADLGLVRRGRGRSAAGREQFFYTVLA